MWDGRVAQIKEDAIKAMSQSVESEADRSRFTSFAQGCFRGRRLSSVKNAQWFGEIRRWTWRGAWGWVGGVEMDEGVLLTITAYKLCRNELFPLLHDAATAVPTHPGVGG